MVDLLLGFFGYVRIPREAVEIAMEIEHLLGDLKKFSEKKEMKSFPIIKVRHDAAIALVDFLKSGRLITEKRDPWI